jgi:hypothetical protein
MISISIGREVFQRFASTISRQPLGLVHHIPEPWAQPVQCIHNVMEKVSQVGGRSIYGWAFLTRVSSFGPYLIAMHHAVWQPRYSTAAVDITPFHKEPINQPYCPKDGSIAFLLDDTAEPKTIGNLIAPLPSRFFPATDDPKLAAYTKRLAAEEEARCQKIYDGGLAAHLNSQRPN